ncbi:hypothetical protein RchiOBHm_Chr5g0066311 [Rosa chinensis]|uniref:Uncharacterized protein n=1 Tax=Rosa chinensis TaxID=74649 RepID=A0A2P6QJ56_ROSCH|nr:hypothetical protein RchiOBHm_Chr5g0066311 [Rosa chinensis]
MTATTASALLLCFVYLVLNMEGWKPCCIDEEELRKPCWKCLIVCI